jgi:glutamate-ammonia-ligase adenylyltransferase
MTRDPGTGSVTASEPLPPPTALVEPATTATLAAHSRFVQRLRRRYTAELPLLADGAPRREAMLRTLHTLQTQGHGLSAALRILRQLVMERLVVLDCERRADLSVVTTAVTELAELALDQALLQAERELDERHGMPCTADGRRAQLWVIGMGKLGARELNVSSDIDLIYIYDQDGETAGGPDGRGRISNHEYFSRAIKTIYNLVGDTTEHGFVFRVDLALRPHGNSGPPAVSLGALEDYLQVQGREWERFAWLKSRVVAPRRCLEDGTANELRGVVLPFVFRRYLDYSVFEALRTLHRQIREHAARRTAGHPERANDVKLSRGGIREIEFIVQLLQVVRGGQFPELRTRSTLDALPRLARAGLMPPATADALAQAYVFLRQVEHRIQYLDDQQTHVLPTQDEDLCWIAESLRFDSCGSFLSELDMHRELVAQEFDILLGGDAKQNCGGNCRPHGAGASPLDFDNVLERLPVDFRQRIAAWREHPRVTALREESRARLMRLVLRTAEWLRDPRSEERLDASHRLQGALRWTDWIETLLRRESYLALLVERPATQERLLRLLGAARWPAQYLLRHPGVIDELASSTMLSERFVPEAFERELEERRRSLERTGEDDEEELLNLLRRAHHAETFRTLARDVEGRLSVEQVADDLSALADTMLRVTARWCWQRMKNAHREEPQFAIIGYGKLGGKELGYGSDLDIVFVYEDEDERAPEAYAAFVRKMINWLTVKTREGDLFEIDTALRPNGSSGLLITSFDSYANYQRGRGSNTAWTWEHQAMTRARFVAGVPALVARFDEVRSSVVTAERDPAALRSEIVAMREKVRAAHPVRGERFDLKHSVGGMVDAEFAVQYLVLSQSGRHPELIANVGNIALLQRAEAVGLLPAGIGRAAGDAYRSLRHLQHQARLDEASTQLDVAAIAPQRDAVLALWRAVFG